MANDVSPLEAEVAVAELATIRALLDKAGVPDRGVGASTRVAEVLGDWELLGGGPERLRA